ncbi:L-serine ammonia-lyase, iron-sulfur-dependent, subunit alpha [Brevibacillus laterosporus]|uniref:L-serine ammonia-lyase, iron-sulfur-dependent, subunit alpha n=1 Tax=Brevibacillus laterosporus TaxID=1465 RepID=UPI003CF7C498
MFRNVAELVELAESQGKPISQIMIEAEMNFSERSRESIMEEMYRNLDVMEKAVQRGLTEDIRSYSGLTGGDAKRLQQYMKEKPFRKRKKSTNGHRNR